MGLIVLATNSIGEKTARTNNYCAKNIGNQCATPLFHQCADQRDGLTLGSATPCHQAEIAADEHAQCRFGRNRIRPSKGQPFYTGREPMPTQRTRVPASLPSASNRLPAGKADVRADERTYKIQVMCSTNHKNNAPLGIHYTTDITATQRRLRNFSGHNR